MSFRVTAFLVCHPQRFLHSFEANDNWAAQRRFWPSVAPMIQILAPGHLAVLPTVFLTLTIPKPSEVFHRLIQRFRTQRRFLEAVANLSWAQMPPNLRLRVASLSNIASHGFADLKFPDRSGLFLGFDHVTGDDGLLQIREIRDLRLRADLVTLSACGAGAGKLEGQNGIASIVQAFLFAGARSVVASLWTADDTFTASLMARFYRGLAAGMPIGGALRSAKLEMIDRFGAKAVPLLWAGFFVTGDPATHISLRKRNDQYQTVNRSTP